MDGRAGPHASDQRRRAILNAALDRFLAGGYESTRLSDIRRTCGASTGTLYHYFPGGKAEIAAALTVEGLATYQARLLAGVTDHGDAEAGVRAGVLIHLAWIDDHRGLARFLFADRPPEVDAAAGPRLAELNRHFFGGLRGWMRPLIDAGVLAELPTQVLVALWVGPAQLVGRLHVTGQLRLPLAEAAPMLADAAWAALRAPGAAPPGRSGGPKG